MIPEDTYISYLPHRLIRVLDADHAVLAATIADMCSHAEDGTMEISLEYLSTIHGISKRTLQRQLQKLQQLQVIVYDSGDGRGNFGKFKKGDNFDTLSGIKGDKNGTLINKDILTAAERADKRAHAAEKNAAADGELEKGSPRQRKEDKMIQQQFEEFWTLFAAKDEYQNRKERCERVWYATSAERREAYIKALRAGKKHRDNPLHYLQYDTPEEAKAEFPIFVNGDGSLADAIHDAESGGRALAFVRGGLQLHINQNFAHIYLDDAIAQKIRVIRTIPRQAIEQVPAELRENQQ